MAKWIHQAMLKLSAKLFLVVKTLFFSKLGTLNDEKDVLRCLEHLVP